MIVEEKHEVRLVTSSGWDPRIRMVECGDMVRCYLIRSERFLVVYDTLLGPKSGGWLRTRAEEFAGGRPIVVVTSHADWDHYFGNQAFSGAILGSSLCAARVLGRSGRSELQTKRSEHPEEYRDLRLTPPNITFSGEAVIDGGDLKMVLFPTLGHRPDHLSLYLPELKILFPGDTVEDPIPLLDEDPGTGQPTIAQLIASLEQQEKLQPEWVLANHAPPERGVGRLKENRAYLVRLLETARGASSSEQLEESLPESPEWGDFYKRAHRFHLACAWEQRAL